MQACEYFLHEKHLKAACSTLGDRLFSCSRTELLASEHKPSLDTNNNTSPTPGYRYDITGKYVVAGKRSPSLGYSPQFRSSPNPSCSGSGEFMSSAEPISSPDMMSTPDRMSSPEYSPDGVCDYITSVEQVLLLSMEHSTSACMNRLTVCDSFKVPLLFSSVADGLYHTALCRHLSRALFCLKQSWRVCRCSPDSPTTL